MVFTRSYSKRFIFVKSVHLISVITVLPKLGHLQKDIQSKSTRKKKMSPVHQSSGEIWSPSPCYSAELNLRDLPLEKMYFICKKSLSITDSLDMSLSELQETVRTGKLVMLQSMGLQRVGHNLATEQSHINSVKLKEERKELFQHRSYFFWQHQFGKSKMWMEKMKQTRMKI